MIILLLSLLAKEGPLISTNFVCENNHFKLAVSMNNSVVENIRFWYHGNEYPINEWRVSFDDKLKFLNIGVRTFEGPYDAEINGIVYLLKNNDYPENFPEFDHVVTWISTAMLSIGHQERRIYNIPCVGDDYKGSITAYRR